jgi:hypothetical protein
MREAIFKLGDFVKKGLALKNNVRNRPFLIQSLGAFPYEQVLQSVKQFTRIDTSSLGALTFPYPQLFVLSEAIIVCTPTAIYEYAGGALSLKLSGLTAGNTWTVLDYKSFIYLTNQEVAVTKDPATGTYSISTLPAGNACCDYNGQVLLSG